MDYLHLYPTFPVLYSVRTHFYRMIYNINMASLYCCTRRLSWPGIPARRDFISQWDLRG